MEKRVLGIEETEQPTIEEGKIMVVLKTKQKKKYEAYGSDDMMPDNKPKKKFFGEKLESGKKVFGKIGNFFTRQVKNISNMKLKKSSGKNKKEEDTSENEMQEDREEKKGVFKGFTNNVVSVSGKIGGTLRKLSNKTINIASGTTNFIKKKSSNLIINKNEESIKSEIVQGEESYQKYLDESPQKKEEEGFDEPKTELNSESDQKYDEFFKEQDDASSGEKKTSPTKRQDSISEDDDVYLI